MESNVIKKKKVRPGIKITDEELAKSKLETDKMVLKKWSESRVTKQRLKAASNPSTSKTVLRILKQDKNQYVSEAADKNLQMLDEIEKQSKSKVTKTRVKVAENPKTPTKIINKLLLDEEEKVAREATLNPNIDETTLDVLLQLNSDTRLAIYRSFLSNKSFKPEWAIKIILTTNNPQVMFGMIDNQTILEDEEHWIEMVKLIGTIDDNKLIEAGCGKMLYNFFRFPSYNFSEKQILVILETFGNIIQSEAPGTFDAVYNNNLNGRTDIISNELYKLTKNEKFLPNDVKDIFVF